MTQQIKQPTLFQALIPLVALVIMLASSVYFFGEDSSYGPNQIALWISGAKNRKISQRLVGLANLRTCQISLGSNPAMKSAVTPACTAIQNSANSSPRCSCSISRNSGKYSVFIMAYVAYSIPSRLRNLESLYFESAPNSSISIVCRNY